MECDTQTFTCGKYTVACFVKLIDRWSVYLNYQPKCQITMHAIQSSRRSSLAFPCSSSSHSCFPNMSFVDLYVFSSFHISSLFLVKFYIFTIFCGSKVGLQVKKSFCCTSKNVFLKKDSIAESLLINLYSFILHLFPEKAQGGMDLFTQILLGCYPLSSHLKQLKQ